VVVARVRVAFAVAAGVTPLCAQSNPYTDSCSGQCGRSLTQFPRAAIDGRVSECGRRFDTGIRRRGWPPRTRTFEVTPVFQIAFARLGDVDAGMSHEAAGKDGVYHQTTTTNTGGFAGRALIVATHEHYDHVDGVIRSPYFGEVAPGQC